MSTSTSTSTPALTTYLFLYLLLPGLRTPGRLSSQPAALTSYPPPFWPPRVHILTRLLRLRKHKGGTKVMVRTVGQDMLGLRRTDGRNTGGRAGKEETNQVQVQAGTIHLFHPLFYINFHVNQTSYLTLPLIGLLFRHRHLHRHTFPRASIQLLPSPPSSATSTLVYVYSVISSAVFAVFGQLSREEVVSGGELRHEGLACTHLCTTPDHNHLTFSSTLPKSISKALHPLIFFH
jgi:hypothetical protein